MSITFQGVDHTHGLSTPGYSLFKKWCLSEVGNTDLAMAVKLSNFPVQLMVSNWVYKENKVHDSKLHSVSLTVIVYSRYIGRHVRHARSYTIGKKKTDIEAICEAKYHELVAALKIKYPDASVVEFLPYVTMKKVKKIVTIQFTDYPRTSGKFARIHLENCGKIRWAPIGCLRPAGRGNGFHSVCLYVIQGKEERRSSTADQSR